MNAKTISIVVVALVVAARALWSQGRGNPNEWPTAHGDAQHTSWIRADANISPETMSQPGFELQWKTRLEGPVRQGVSLTSGVVTSAVNLFTPLSTLAGPGNQISSLDNDTGNLFWSRRFDGALGAATATCPGGITGAPTRIAALAMAPVAPARGGNARGGQSYSSAVGEPGAGVPVQGRAAGGRAATPPTTPPAAPTTPPATGRAAVPPPTQTPAALPPSPFPTNPQAVAAAGGPGGNLFRSSGVVYAVSADGMFRTLGLVSGKDVQRPAPFLPARARFSDLIGVGDMVYAATSGGCGGAPSGIWAINSSGDPKTVVSWKSNGGDPIGSMAFATNGTLIAAIGAGAPSNGGHANAIVALDPKTLAVRDWFTRAGIEIVAPPVVFQDRGKDIVVSTTRDGRVLLLDAASLGGADHATPLVLSPSLSGGAAFSVHPPAMWQERSEGGTRWLLVPVAGRVAATSAPSTHGAVSSGAILGLKVVSENGAFSVRPGWISENITGPITPIVVNEVVFGVSSASNAPATLYALNGVSGQTLWQSGRTMTSALSGQSFWTGSGHVLIGTLDGTVYAFGFAMERK